MSPFLICGLPRSRTAWLSLACWTNRSICYHEPTAQYSTWQGIDEIWRGSRYNFTGISDSMLGFHLPEILERWKPRTLIIERPRAEVHQAMARKFGDIGAASRRYIDILDERLKSVDHALIRRVPYDDLSRVEVVWNALRHLVLDARIDYEKLVELMRLNVQEDGLALAELWQKAQGHAEGLLGEDVVAELRSAA